MNKAELVESVAEKSGLTKKVSEQAINALTTAITEALGRGEKVSLIGFGTFEVRQRSARTGRNPATKETITIPASKAPAFKPGRALKEAL